MNPTVLARSFRLLTRIPWVRSRYPAIAPAEVGMSGKNAGSGVQGTVWMGPCIGTGVLYFSWYCSAVIALPPRLSRFAPPPAHSLSFPPPVTISRGRQPVPSPIHRHPRPHHRRPSPPAHLGIDKLIPRRHHVRPP